MTSSSRGSAITHEFLCRTSRPPEEKIELDEEVFLWDRDDTVSYLWLLENEKLCPALFVHSAAERARSSRNSALDSMRQLMMAKSKFDPAELREWYHPEVLHEREQTVIDTGVWDLYNLGHYLESEQYATSWSEDKHKST